MTTYEAGNGNKLSIIRSSDAREQSVQHERIAAENIMPGQLVTPTTQNGNEAYAVYDGTVADDDYHIAVEARGRGMDAQTDSGYPADDLVKARESTGAGEFNLSLAAGETVTDGDALVANASGRLTAYVSADDAVTDIVAHAAEDADLSGATDPALVAVNME